MKILYVITKSNWGGAQKHVYDLAIAMKDRGHNVVVGLGGDGVLRRKLEDAGIKTHSIAGLGRDINVGSDAGSLKEIFSIIRREKPDALHLHSPKAAGLGSFAGRLLRVKNIIYTVHGWAFNEDRSFLQKIPIAFFSWLTMIFCHKVLLLSNREYSQTLHFPYVKDKLVLVPPGMKQPIFMSVDGSKLTMAKTLGMNLAEYNKKIVLGVIAELHPNKGYTYLLEALSQVVNEHPNLLCLIIGDGDQRTLLSNMIAERKLGDNVRIMGYVEDASHYLKAFNIFALPSVKEGLPYVLLEAGYASLPVIATTVGGIPEVVEDMKSGVLVQPKNYRELAHAISFMIEHPSMRKQYGTALRSAVVEKYSMEKMVEKVEDIYSKVPQV